MLRKSGATAGKIWKKNARARTYLRWLVLLFFAMPHTKRYKKYQLGRSSIIFYLYLRLPMYAKLLPFQELLLAACFSASEQILRFSGHIWPIHIFFPTTRRNIHFSTAAAAAPPSASHPRRPRQHGAALRGWKRPRRRGRAADLCGGQGGRSR